MYVKKFEADTLDEALKAVKQELGPDAIILKTLTNKGIKGAFKKKKIEITAAISHKSYEKKSHVDKVLNPEQKNQFYTNRSEKISEAIDDYSQRKATVKTAQPVTAAGYGQMGLNKMVNTLSQSSSDFKDFTQKASKKIKHSLDDFLNQEEVQSQDVWDEPTIHEDDFRQAMSREVVTETPVAIGMNKAEREIINELKSEIKTQQNKITVLEQKLFELVGQLPSLVPTQKEASGLHQLKTTLKTLEVDQTFIMAVIKKAISQLTKEELEDAETVFEFALHEMARTIHVDQALFSKMDEGKPVITAIVSEAASGQTSMCMKIAVLKKDVVIIQYAAEGEHEGGEFTAKVFGIKLEKAKNLSELLNGIRKATEANLSVILDLRLMSKNGDEAKKVIDTLSRSFQNLEVLLNLSAIHSEMYNRKIVARYKDLSDGIIISHIDLCMNFGAIFNLHRGSEKLPLKFFGTGTIVPDDIEAASSERIMAGLFQLG
jgi:flagellar biosynthesis protein FlhF